MKTIGHGEDWVLVEFAEPIDIVVYDADGSRVCQTSHAYIDTGKQVLRAYPATLFGTIRVWENLLRRPVSSLSAAVELLSKYEEQDRFIPEEREGCVEDVRR